VAIQRNHSLVLIAIIVTTFIKGSHTFGQRSDAQRLLVQFCPLRQVPDFQGLPLMRFWTHSPHIDELLTRERYATSVQQVNVVLCLPNKLERNIGGRDFLQRIMPRLLALGRLLIKFVGKSWLLRRRLTTSDRRG